MERGKQDTERGSSAAQNCMQNPRTAKTAILHWQDSAYNHSII